VIAAPPDRAFHELDVLAQVVEILGEAERQGRSPSSASPLRDCRQ
jgi:hypothetical protein